MEVATSHRFHLRERHGAQQWVGTADDHRRVHGQEVTFDRLGQRRRDVRRRAGSSEQLGTRGTERSDGLQQPSGGRRNVREASRHDAAQGATGRPRHAIAGRAACKLEGEHRVPRRHLRDPRQLRARQGGHHWGDELADPGVVEPAEHDLECLLGRRHRGQAVPRDGPLRRDHRQPVVAHPPQGVAQGSGRHRVEPLHVVDRQGHRSVGSQLTKHAEHGATAIERVGVGREQRGVGGDVGEEVTEAHERPLQLVLRRPGDDDAMTAVAQLVDGGSPQRRLADAGLAADDHTPQIRRVADECKEASQLRFTTRKHRLATVTGGSAPCRTRRHTIAAV